MKKVTIGLSGMVLIGLFQNCTGFTNLAAKTSGSLTSTFSSRSSQAIAGITLPAGIDGIATSSSPNSAVIPCGDYQITTPIVITSPGFQLSGIDEQCVKIHVTGNFPMSSQGVIVFQSGEPGPVLQNFTIEFDQNLSGDPSLLTQYPPAIFAQNTPRFQVNNLQIDNAWVGIDMKLNSGGAFIQNLEISAYNIGVDIDGSLDTVRIDNMHFWPFGGSEALIAGATGINSGRMDDLVVDGYLSNARRGMHFYYGTSLAGYPGYTGALITNADFDTVGGIFMEDGNVSCVSCNFSSASNSYRQVEFTGGTLRIDASEFWDGVSGPQAAISIDGPGYVTISNSTWNGLQGDLPFIKTNVPSGILTLTVTGNTFTKTPNIAYSQPAIYLSGPGTVRYVISDNQITDKGTGAGNFLQIDTVDWGSVTNNILLNYGMLLPVGYSDYATVTGNQPQLIATQ